MQYYPQFIGYPNGETNYPYAPNSLDRPAVAAPPAPPRSQVVGEGDVTSVTLPDGTLQLYFVPAPRYLGSYLPWGAVPVWFIRTIPNLFAAPHTLPANHRDNAQSSNAFLFPNKPEESEEKLKYQWQFHNDKTTSSTDMHYFSQTLHPCTWYSKPSVETQADQPVRLYDAGCKCCQACHCKLCGRRTLGRASDMSIGSTADEDRKTHSKVTFGSDTSDDKFCDNCNNKCKGTRKFTCTSEKANATD